MNYLIFYNGDAFYTNSFDIENNYVPGMIVFNLLKHEIFNGDQWKKITQDHL